LKLYFPYIVLAVTFLMLPAFSYAQYSQYNLNINNGLPSNHVYYVLKDKEGYLWISTDKGVVKYNGYDFKLFDQSVGMANDDIWHLYEDKKQRIWLSNISNEFGYIKNDQYHKTVIISDDQPLYPIYITENENGIVFLNHSVRHSFCQEKNDTITCLPMDIPVTSAYLQKGGALIIIKDTNCFRVTIGSNGISYKQDYYHPKGLFYYLYGNYFVPLPYKADKDHMLRVIDKNNGHQWATPMEHDENIYMANEYNATCYLTGNKGVYELRSNTGIKKILSLKDMRNHKFKENDILTVSEDDFWKQCIATNSSGLFINFQNSRFQSVKDEHRIGYIYVGNANDSSHYWWNKSKRMLMRYDKNEVAHVEKHPDILDITKIVPISGNRSIVLTESNIYTIKKDKLTDFFAGIDIMTLIYDFPNNPKQNKELSISGYTRTFTDCVEGESNELFLLRVGGGCITFNRSKDSLSVIFFDKNRYKHLVYDKIRKVYWTCNTDLISIFGKGFKYEINKRVLSQLGIRKVENILVDNKYGNIFLKCDDRLLLWDIQKRSYKELYKNYNLKGSIELINNNRLIVAGKFGVLFSTVHGLNDMGAPVLYQNIKNTSYNYVSDLEVSNTGQIILNTNNGLLSVTMPADSLNRNIGPYLIPPKFMIHYHDSIYTAPNSLITIAPADPVLQPDIINPYGNGTLHYSYKINETDIPWRNLSEDKIYLQGLIPGRHYTLSIVAYDDVWKSSPVNFTIQIRPHWWQTSSGKKILWVTGILFVALLIVIIIQVTKGIVTRNSAKKNMQLELSNLNLELELKSIYGQINPHFIFNTLNTALYFIKKKKFEEAFTHVSAFSNLLRSYIKSSRNKFISLAEEIENIQHYILLQQARFEEKFVYHISVDEEIQTQSTQIPSLLFQPIIENAINHGLLHKEEELGHLEISFKKDNQENILICSIEDDGIGREKAMEYRAQSSFKTTSYGSELIKELINTFNKTGHVNIEIQYIDKVLPQTGTIVIITITYLDKTF